MTPKAVRSRDNPAFKSLLKLATSSRDRRDSGHAVLEGEHLVESFRASGLGEAQMLAAGESALERASLRDLFETTPANSRVVLADRLMSALTELASTAGLLAVIATPRPAAGGAPLGDALLLERIQDPGNLGSILRSALAAGMRDVYLSPGTVHAWSPKVVRAGMGAHFALRIHENADLAELAGRARGAVFATRVRAAKSLYEADLRGPVAWLFGNEGSGLTETAGAGAEGLTIPMGGPVESLNVAAAVAVCLFEQLRQRSATRPPGA
jgi:TrmH family RNA methyltransferase